MPLPAPVIRPFTAQDHAALMQLWCSAWEAVYPQIDFRARWPGMLARWDEMASAGARADVAEIGGTVAGFTVVDVARRHLDQIAVDPAFLGSPVARALMAHAKALCPEGLSLDVNQSNGRAIRFYEREGFVRVGEGVNPYSGLATWRFEWSPLTSAARAR